jgi:hypothetical protein
MFSAATVCVSYMLKGHRAEDVLISVLRNAVSVGLSWGTGEDFWGGGHLPWALYARASVEGGGDVNFVRLCNKCGDISPQMWGHERQERVRRAQLSLAHVWSAFLYAPCQTDLKYVSVKVHSLTGVQLAVMSVDGGAVGWLARSDGVKGSTLPEIDHTLTLTAHNFICPN